MGRRVERGFLHGPIVVAAQRQVNDARIRRALPGRAAAVPRRRVGEEDVERRGQARLPNHICGEAGEVGRAHPAEQIPALPLRRQDSILEPPRQVKADE